MHVRHGCRVALAGLLAGCFWPGVTAEERSEFVVHGGLDERQHHVDEFDVVVEQPVEQSVRDRHTSR